ncbi:MAG: MerR family transcriptional regulator [Erysipelotrichaceae bacterium]|nr:MerR family transcriptional regulator [Erysipelotrichaceae bacterium]
MRIHEVAKQIGLTKKAIHFYVSEGLVHPLKLENNYYEFTSEDINRLHQILFFRKAGISIQTIKEIYDYPEATNFFLHRSFHQLKKEISEKLAQLQNLETILQSIPPNGTPLDVEKIPVEHFKHQSEDIWIESMHPNFDERMIAILILAPFMDVQVDEYKQYLWDKIFNDLKIQFKNDLSVLTNIIYSLNGNQIRESSSFQFNLFKQISQQEDLKPFVNYLIQCTHQLIFEENIRQRWILLYDPVIRPILSFFQTTSQRKRLSQYNPLFEQCALKMESIIQKCVQLIKNTDFEKELIQKLDGKIQIDESLYSDFFVIFTFHKSIYTQCTLIELEKFVSKDA